MNEALRRKCVFLDRDGTLVPDIGYPSRPEHMELLPGAAKALRELADAGYLLVVVSNQSGVARGYFDTATVDELNRVLAQNLARQGARVDSFVYCIHHPEFTGPCDCRKPEPGMLLSEAARLDIDISQSWMAGDKASDVEAGRRAGCRTVFVRTGDWAKEEKKMARSGCLPDAAVDGMGELSQAILAVSS